MGFSEISHLRSCAYIHVMYRVILLKLCKFESFLGELMFQHFFTSSIEIVISKYTLYANIDVQLHSVRLRTDSSKG